VRIFETNEDRCRDFHRRDEGRAHRGSGLLHCRNRSG
jgi:hypothetical protein